MAEAADPRLRPSPPSPTRRDVARLAILGAAGAALGDAGLALEPPAAPAPPGSAGPARARVDGAILTIGNDAVEAEWRAGTGLSFIRVTDRRSRRSLSSGRGAFVLVLSDGTVLDAAAMPLVSPPRVEELAPAPSASRFSSRLPGKRLVAVLEDAGKRVRAEWSAVLRDGSAYVRQEVTLTPLGKDLPPGEIGLLDLDADHASVSGTVQGSPLLAGTFFLGVESPLSSVGLGAGRARAWLHRETPVGAGRSATLSSVVGATGGGSPRRAVLAYVERERAHPYRSFLHYNSWYDLGYFTRFDEAGALAVIEAYGRELVQRRGVVLDSFLFDDGWDDRKLWGFHEGFPRGFTPLTGAAARYGSAPGVWLSPWGGYGKPKQERLSYAKEQGFEVVDGGFALSGPVYYRRFREVCLEMVRKYGVNQLKVDGTGNASRVLPGSEFGSDFEAALALIADLRAEKPGLYVNLTTGTYPSPFWLLHADSIWRGGEDHDFLGEGSDRQRWVTYRDADTFRNVVQRGPLFPLNALMLHGVIYARHAKRLDTDPGGDLGAEVRSYFGTGTQLQELYVTPSLLTPANWDAIAEAARFARVNAATLVDTHWVGGDPARGEAYGWAAWGAGKAIVTMRNPSASTRSLEVEPHELFDLPEGAPERLVLRSPWKAYASRPAVTLEAGKPARIVLAPFEVVTLEGKA